MKVEIKLSKAEAQKVLGTAVKQAFGVSMGDMEVTEVEWPTYKDEVTVTLGEPEKPEPRAVAVDEAPV